MAGAVALLTQSSARAAVGLGALSLATTLLAGSARAEQPGRDVRLVIEDCTPSVLSLHEAYAAAALELGLGDTSGTAPAEPTHVELNAALSCEHGVKAKLTLKTANQSASRTIPLDDVRVKDRSRVLALALAELVRAEWRWVTTGKSTESEPPLGDERHRNVDPASRDESAPGDAATPPGSGASTAARPPGDKQAEKRNAPAPALVASTTATGDRASAPASPAGSAFPERGLALEVLGRARELFAGSTFVYGAAVGTRWHRWSASLEALFGQARGELGTANVGFADARVGYELLRITQGRWLFAFEPAIAGGVTWITGTRATPEVTVSEATAFYADARLAFRTEFRAPALNPTLLLEAGRALGFAAQENGTTIAVTGGWFVGGGLGFVMRGL